MKTWKLTDGTKIYLIIGGFYNAYLIVFDGMSILVDTGRKSQWNLLNKNLQHILGNSGKLDYLILTHTHYDHCENAAKLKAYWHCKVLVHQSESSFLQIGSTPLPRGTNIFTYFLTKLGNKYATRKFYYDNVTPDIELEGNHKIESGKFYVELIPTPGHSIGSISININNELAIVGDTMFSGSKRTIFPPFADNSKEMIRSWSLLLNKTKCHTFLPGHGKPITRKRLETELSKRRYWN
jgi:hydroxyacylglutathione hydrolase